MNIIISFNNDFIKYKYNYKDKDIILANNYKCKQTIKNCVIVNYSKYDESTYLPNSINNFFSSLPPEFSNFKNTFFMRLFRPLNSVILQLEELINIHKPQNIVLIGGSTFKFITLFGGEGEGEYSFYHPSWLFNSFINDNFKDRVNIIWIKRNPAFLLKLFHVVREHTIFISKIILYNYKNIKYRLRNNFLKNNKLNKQIFAFVNLPLQLKHLENILDNLPYIDINYISPVVSRISNEKVITYKVRLFDYFIIRRKFNKIQKENRYKSIAWLVNGKGNQINSKIIFQSIKLQYYYFYYNYYALKKILTPKINFDKVYFVTNMTFGDDIILINKISNEFKIPHYNFQAVSMSKMLFPQINLADKYFLYSRQTYELYKTLSNTYYYYLPINFKVKSRKSGNTIVLSVFTQPDYLTDQYLDFLSEILPKLSKISNLKLIIKPHYRQDKISDFIKISNKYSFVEIYKSKDLPEEIIKNSDFIISISSSVLFESITLNCPAIIIDFNGLNQKFIYESDVCFSEINFVVKNSEELLEIVSNSERYKEKFFIRRENYINQNSGIAIKDVFQDD